MSEKKKFGVVLDKVKPELLTAALKDCGIEPAATVPEMVGQLVGHYRKTAPDVKKLAQCDCGGVFPNELKVCPYCGDVDDAAPKVESSAATTRSDVSPAATKAAKKVKLDRPPKMAIVKNSQLPPELVNITVDVLDKATAEIIKLKTGSAKAMWELGVKIREVHDRQLYKLRTNDDGKPTYRTFEQYCAAEVQMSGNACYDLIKVAEHYTQETVALLGTSKLRLILKAPEEDRAALEQKAMAGASTNALRRDVKTKKKKTVAPKAERTTVTGKPAPPVGKGRQLEHLTIVSVIGKKTLPCYVKPQKRGDPLVPVSCPAKVQEWLAKSQPFAFDDVVNGVREVMALTSNSKGELQIKIDRKRLADAVKESGQ